MTATALLAELLDAGIQLTARGDRLHLEAKPGVVTQVLRERLALHKAELLAAVRSEPRTQLVSVASNAGLPHAIAQRLHADDVAACAGLPDETLLAYLRALDRGTFMDAGIAPEGYTQAAHCDGCGPVWLWQGAPDRLIACPWCFRRKAGKALPRPQVTCGDCHHYSPDPLNPAAGVGACALGAGRAWWPMKRHRCAEHQYSGAGQ